MEQQSNSAYQQHQNSENQSSRESWRSVTVTSLHPWVTTVDQQVDHIEKIEPSHSQREVGGICVETCFYPVQEWSHMENKCITPTAC